ncbi:glycosyltransferase family 1 protein [Chitinophaga silvatica]|uniref:Glycosyltransferase family 1 protein n=1 Tax=Chitinophaga silvatica TaxID=2282649 RepID=A0A3E1YCQ2_9BACT|nr:glycosyltransferase family 1 protein [Chitinophaga silvatica]RFS23991.1 glycosyltransferase family 1 protein [Chitinophaga silvatica]
MQIAVNAACLRQDKPADTGLIATEILLAMFWQQPEHQFTCFFDGEIPVGLEFPTNVTPVVIPRKGNKSWHYYWWLEWQLVKAMKPFKPDRYLGFDTLPLRSNMPATLLIKDLAYMNGASVDSPSYQKWVTKNSQKYFTSASNMAVLSSTLATELVRYSPESSNKITQLVPGLSPDYKPLEWDDREAVKKKYTDGAEYFLVLGALHPRNNIIPLLKAFSALKKRQRSNIKLVLAGSKTAAGMDILEALQTYRFRHDVVILDSVSNQTELASLIGAAYTLIYPPRFEGFAWPILAAQRCKVPVIALDSPAAREAGGEAVLYVDPSSQEDLSEKMSLLYKDEMLRSRLLDKEGTIQPYTSWEKAATVLFELLKG